MNISAIILIAISLSMDSFAVSISSGLSLKKIQITQALKIALYLSIFQGLAPVIGWAIGNSVQDLISSVDHWISFSLLSLIGINMILESRKTKTGERKISLSHRNLSLLGIATSIDAVVIGVSFAFIEINISTAAIIIAITTFTFSIAGTYIGNKTGHIFENKMELIAGLILIGIGTKILIEHLYLTT